MLLGEKIKSLRKEKGLSQHEFAEKIGADARQISRYETGRITPSVEAIIKIAKVFDVSIDYLLLTDAARKSLKVDDPNLMDRFQVIQILPEEDRACVFHILDAFLAKRKIKSLATELG
ncbi:MAG: helix-turn-helix transcriptional regulator [Candidatus Riflebacteria bacterium]|nr:helix-turn-helix transcriptional regulator [Candidatus Riflebacteria bacterium]